MKTEKYSNPRRLRPAIILALVFLLNLGGPLALQAVLIVAPTNAQTLFDGNAVLRPFDTGPARFQQVYDASLFSALMPSGGGFIVEIDFRVDARGYNFDNSIGRLQINMSVTQRAPDGLSPIFDENTGWGDTEVLDGELVRFSSAGAGSFDAFFGLTNPFLYDPTQGNLLVDFRIYQGFVYLDPPPPPDGIAILDAFNVVGDSVSSVYARGTTLPTVGQTSSLGLANIFVVAPIPEPSTLTLLAVGLGWLLWRGLGLRKSRKE